MLKDLHLQVLESHALWELLINPLGEQGIEKLEEQASEFGLVLFDLLAFEVCFGLFDLFKVVLGIIPHEKVLSL